MLERYTVFEVLEEKKTHNIFLPFNTMVIFLKVTGIEITIQLMFYHGLFISIIIFIYHLSM